MASPTTIVAYLALFTAAGFLFLFVNLLVGKFLRPKSPNAEKLEVYECGEPTIGSSFVQFDLRFYVVALAVHHLRRGSRVLLSLGHRVRQGHAPDGPEHGRIVAGRRPSLTPAAAATCSGIGHRSRPGVRGSR